MNFVSTAPMTDAKKTTIGKGNPLWDFALWAYDEPDVEKACLALQNRLGADVLMIMFCLWLAQRGTPGGYLARYLGAAIKLSRDWQRSFVEPLRTCRLNFKDFIVNTTMAPAELDAANALRDRIKQSELDMEQLQMLAMYSLVVENEVIDEQRSATEQRQDAQNNLNVYFSATGVKLDPLGQTHVICLLQSVFG
ncbi:MAG: TIGR02444 family protein [Rhodospirillaceae bacterium]|nr:TIGR02444 family protein [Rhodospirillaceae bacterium]